MTILNFAFVVTTCLGSIFWVLMLLGFYTQQTLLVKACITLLFNGMLMAFIDKVLIIISQTINKNLYSGLSQLSNLLIVSMELSFTDKLAFSQDGSGYFSFSSPF
jgi:hypothetical protein